MSFNAAVLLIFIAALAGVFCGDSLWRAQQVSAGSSMLLGMAMVVSIAIALRYRRGTVLVSCVAVFIVTTHSTQVAQGPPPPSAQATEGIQTLWRVRVLTTPAQVRPKLPKRGARAIVALEAQLRRDGWHAECGQAQVTLWPGPLVARGDVLLVRLVVRPLPDTAPPWGKSAARFARDRGVSAQALVCGLHAHADRAHGIASLCDHARQRAAARLQRLLPDHLAGIASALALGDTQGITPDHKDAWADAGMAHLLAVSGLHVGLVARAVMAWLTVILSLWPPLAERMSVRRISCAAALPFVWGYALFTGGAVSAVRSACMLSLVLMGYVLGRGRGSSVHALALAGVLIVTIDPLAALGPGFWLSFVSVACLLGSPLLPWGLERPGSGWARYAHGLWLALCTGVIAALGTAPLCGLFFGRFSVVAPITNLIAVPLGGVVATPLAIATTVLSAFAPEEHAAVRACAWACAQALQALDVLARSLSALPWAALEASPLRQGIIIVLCFITALVAAVNLLQREGFITAPVWRFAIVWPWAAALAAAVVIGAGVSALTLRRPTGSLTLWHLDVAQGDSTLIGLPDGTWVLVDGGGASFAGQSDPGRWAVAPALKALGITRLRAVVLTHPHPDHMNGLAYVLGRWPVDVFWRTQEAHNHAEVQALEALVHRGGGRAQLPPSTAVWGGVDVRAWMPLVQQRVSINDHSIVLELSYGARRALLMGDAERAAEQDLLACLRPVDILKVGHHGSRTSTTQALLLVAQPDVAVISCGPHNRFGHPHDSTLLALERHGARVLRTDLMGPVMLRTDGTHAWTQMARRSGWREEPIHEKAKRTE